MDPPQSASTVLFISSPESDYETDEMISETVLEQRILHKDIHPILEVKSIMNLLHKLYHENHEISLLVYKREMENQYDILSTFVECNINNEKQALHVIQVILTKHSTRIHSNITTTTTTPCCSFQCCLKYLYLSAILSTTFVVIAIIVNQLLPLFQNVSPWISMILFYILAILVLCAALWMQRSTSSIFIHITQILSIVGASLLSAAYHYSLHYSIDDDDHDSQPSPSPIFYLLDVISWFLLAIRFQLKSMGFISIGILLFMTHLYSLEILCLTSILLVSIHVIYMIQVKDWLIQHNFLNPVVLYYDLLEVGILYLGILCLTSSLILLSLTSKIPFTWTEWTIFNLLSMAVSGTFFYLGWKFSTLYILRGVCCIFTAIYITSKWYDIHMASSLYYFQRLGGCLLLLVMLLQLQSRPYLFLPRTNTRIQEETVELSNHREEIETSISVMDNDVKNEQHQEKLNIII